MRCWFYLIVLVALLANVEAVMVRITNRKPKWVVNAEKEKATLSKKEDTKKEVPTPTPTPEPASPAQTTTPSKPAISKADMDVSRRREPVSFFGKFAEMKWLIGPTVLQPLAEVCDLYIDAQYRFIVCPYRFINQVEIGGNFFRGCIG